MSFQGLVDTNIPKSPMLEVSIDGYKSGQLIIGSSEEASWAKIFQGLRDDPMVSFSFNDELHMLSHQVLNPKPLKVCLGPKSSN